MKVRRVKDDLLAPNPEKIKDFGYAYSEAYTIKVITPIYGGGVVAETPDKEMPIRASAIRGQLRYWWRFLKMNGEDAITDTDKQVLFKEERELWGGMGDEKELKESEQKDFSSKVFINITHCSKIQTDFCCQYEDKNNNIKKTPIFLHNIPSYALFPGQGKSPISNDYNPDTDKRHQVILPNLEFKLNLFANNLTQAQWMEIKEAMRWWVSFGGIGARTRRGLGSIEVLNHTFEPITESEIKKYNCRMNTITATAPIDAWVKAIDKLKQFRQTGVGRIGTGRSKWPEPDSIREITKLSTDLHKPDHDARVTFPRAAFGLPIIFKFKDDNVRNPDPFQTELRPIDAERMTSPLILKAMATGKDKHGNAIYKAIALMLPINHQDDLTLVLKGVPNKPSGLLNEEEQRWKKGKWEEWPKKWWDKSKAINVEPINNNDAVDPLSAFMNFFISKKEDDSNE